MIFRLTRSRLSRNLSTSSSRYAGHNKWSKIKDKKGAKDLQKSLIYSKASHEILTAAKVGGSADPALNLQLATALKRAKELGVPRENIEKAIARATGGKEGSGTRLVYEALAFDSVGLIIECCTDNINRTLHNIREILSSRGARIAPVKFMFERHGRVAVSISKSHKTELLDKVLDSAIDNGAGEMNEVEGLVTRDSVVVEFLCQPENLGQLEAGIRQCTKDAPQVGVLSAELIYVPCNVQVLEGEERQRVEDLVEDLETDADTFKVYTSMNIRS